MEKLLDHFIPNHYSLNFNINKSRKLLQGTTTIKGVAKKSTIKLHAKYLNISSVQVNSQPVNFSLTDDILSLKTPTTSQPIFIEINYSHKLTTAMQGAYLSTYKLNGKTETIVATQFESHYARECFPCIDEPAAKATFDIAITTNSADSVISNMPIKSKVKHQSTFETTPRMSTYLVAFVIGKFKKHSTTSKHGIAVTTYASLAQPDAALQYATDFAAQSLDLYDGLFKVPYPLPKLDQVALPDFESGAMENWGLVTYREQALLCTPDSANDQKLFVATVIAHELSHQWFGNLVTMAWWDDLWLNESFASLIETYATGQISPQLGAWDDFYSGTIVPALRRDCLPGVQPVKCPVNHPAEIATLFDSAIVYAKGAHLMLMLLRLMGETNFFAGLTDYFKKYAYANTTADDLWDSLSPYADFDIKSFMTPWLTQPGYPVLTGKAQSRFLLAKNPTTKNFHYPIPTIKDDLSGHYIIQLSTPKFNSALNALHEKSKEQKLRLLIDRQLLAKTPLVNSSSLLDLLKNFRSETEFIIWDILSFIIVDLKIFFSPGTAAENNFKSFIETLARKPYQRLGLHSKANESPNDAKLRPLILSLMAYSENPSFLAAIKTNFSAKNPFNIDPNIRATVLSSLLKLPHSPKNPFSLKNLLNLYQTTHDPELQYDLMITITSTKNPNDIKSLIALLKRSSVIRPSNRIQFFARLARNPHAHSAAMSWLYKNWDWLSVTEGDKTISDYPRIAAAFIRTAADAAAFQAFFTPKLKDPALERTLNIAFSEISTRLDLITSDSSDVIKALTQIQK